MSKEERARIALKDGAAPKSSPASFRHTKPSSAMRIAIYTKLSSKISSPSTSP